MNSYNAHIINMITVSICRFGSWKVRQLRPTWRGAAGGHGCRWLVEVRSPLKRPEHLVEKNTMIYSEAMWYVGEICPKQSGRWIGLSADGLLLKKIHVEYDLYIYIYIYIYICVCVCV